MAGLRACLKKHRRVKPIYMGIVSLVRQLCIGVQTLSDSLTEEASGCSSLQAISGA